MKTFFNHIRIPLLEWYLAAATCYFLMTGMNQSIFVVAVVLGFVHTYILDPVAYALQPDPTYIKEEKSPELLKKEEERLNAKKAKEANGTKKKKGKKQVKREHISMTEQELARPLPVVWKEIGKTMIVCHIIYGYYYCINTYIYVDDMKPVNAFTFGALYFIFNRILGKLIKKWN